MKKERIVYLDILRILAILAVILLHISAQNWVTSFKSNPWHVFNIADSISRWGVPVFVMISGTLFLNREVDTKKLYTKNILRIITAFCTWSLICCMYNYLRGIGTIKDAILMFFQGWYHTWFIFMIVGLYMIVPLLKKIIEDENLTKYFLILSFVFSFVIPQFVMIVNIINPTVAGTLSTMVSNMNIHFVTGYSFYFVFGYYIAGKKIARKNRMLIYCLSILGFLSTIILTILLSNKLNTPASNFYDNFSINVFLESLGVFVFVKYFCEKVKISKKTSNIIYELSKCTFGVYLTHVLIMAILADYFDLNTMSFASYFSVPLIWLIVTIISFGISFILNKIPKINKYIV